LRCICRAAQLNPSTHETVDKKMHYIHQGWAGGVQVLPCLKMFDSTKKLLERNNVTGRSWGCFIPHQGQFAGLSMRRPSGWHGPKRVIINIEKYGTAPAGRFPLAIETAVEEGKLKKGDLVLLAAVGADSQWALRCCGGRI